MSTFTTSVVRIRAIEPIANADAIELAVVGDYRSVVKKDEFSKGELVVYISEASIVPDWILENIGLQGKLSGPEHNRVKAIKLRGCLSQGILLPLRKLKSTTASLVYTPDGDAITVREGDDVKSLLGIRKYEPVIPSYMSGELYNAGTEVTVSYDIENFKRFPDVLVDGEQVVFTEKIHGTFCGVGVLPTKDHSDKHVHNKFVVFSKGLGAQGLCFKDGDESRGNVYFRALTNCNIFEQLEILAKYIGDNTEPILLLGEVYGKGVQDLGYGTDQVAFRVFDVVKGYRHNQRYVDWPSAHNTCSSVGIETVPVLYTGPFSKEVMDHYTNGTETVSGQSSNIREGIVIKPVTERRHEELGRVILKSVSEAYLLRKGNVTEFN